MATDSVLSGRARSHTRRAFHLVLLPCLAALAACEGSHDVTSSGCLPLRVPTQVTLVREAGLYNVREAKTPFLFVHPRNTANDGFSGTQLIRSVPAGSQIRIERLEQAWGFDVGKGRISAFGKLPDGQPFEYGWGGGTTIGRAPWEAISVPNVRTVACGK